MKAILRLFILTAWLLPGVAYAQRATIVGRITDTEGDELPGVHVQIPALQRSVATTENGEFRIPDVPPGTHRLRATFIGFVDYETEVAVTEAREYVVNIELAPSALRLNELVVTGVATRTPKTNLSFSVNTVAVEELPVPATSAATAIQGKVPSVRIAGASAAPGTSPDIQLRGAKTIFGSSNPLIIIDGVLTEGSLADINAEDIASVEVVKGAAASSLYGSRAANGVVNIITKRGTNLRGGQTRVSVRSELGRNFIGFTPEKTTAINRVIENGQVNYDLTEPDAIYDNRYPQISDPVEQFFNPGAYLTNYLSFQGNSERGNTSLYASVQHTEETGVVELTDGQRRLNLRVNLDHSFNQRFSLAASNFYSNANIDQRANGWWVWDSFYYADPDADFLAPNEDGTPYNIAPNRLSRLTENPLYGIANSLSDENRYRFMGHYQVSYRPIDPIDLKVAYGLDRITSAAKAVTPKGRLSVGGPPSQGSVSRAQDRTFAQTLQADALFTRAFGDVDARLNLQYLLESNEFTSDWAGGSVLAIKGMNIRNLELASENLDIGSYSSRINANNYTASLYADYRDRFILDALVRRDGVSLFGSNARWQTFYRLAGAYRLTNELGIPGFQDLKLRASYGTAGLRPPFEARYEVVSLVNGSIQTPVTLGNEDLKPSFSKELELGTDATFLDRFTLSANYARATNTDQILRVDLSPATGFPYQWRNAGTMRATSLEFSLGAQLLRTRDVNWDVNLIWDRTRQKVIELERSDYAIVSAGIFRIAEGENFGTLYGRKWARSLNDVANQVPVGETLEDYFVINNEGYVVRRSEIGTVNEKPIPVRDDRNVIVNVPIGDVNPDFTLNLGSTFDVRKVNLYMLWSWQQGGDMYNHMRRYMMIHGVGAELDQSGKPWHERKPVGYYTGAGLTSGNNDHFVEDATFLKLRELGLTYTLNSPRLNNLIGIDNVRLGLIGRNLLTFTRYSGFDPEAGHSEEGLSATTLKFDISSYPVYRTLTASIGFTF